MNLLPYADFIPHGVVSEILRKKFHIQQKGIHRFFAFNSDKKMQDLRSRHKGEVYDITEAMDRNGLSRS